MTLLRPCSLALTALLLGTGTGTAVEPLSEEPLLSPNLTSQQRASLLLEPEFADAFYGQVDRQYLTGYWKFKPEINLLERREGKVVSTDPKMNKAPATDAGLTQGYFKPEFDASAWTEIPVPWSWNIAARPAAEKAPNRIAFSGLGYYRTSFKIPKEKRGKRVIVHFDSVQTESKIWLNGALVGEHVNSSADAGEYWSLNRRLLLDDFELDVTAQVNFDGENTLVVRVFDDGLPILENNPNDGGIVGAVWIDFRESVSFSDILIDADPNGDVILQAHAVNNGAEVKLPVMAQVDPFKSNSYTPPAQARAATLKLGEVTFPKGESDHRFTFKVSNPVTWDLNNPSLYRLRLTEGQRILGQTRFGFRRMEIREKQFYLNGHPLFLLGVNPGAREQWGSRMWAFNKSDWLRQGLKLYKDVNLNLRRTNNGPSTRICYDICDEIGLLNEEDFSLEVRALAMDDSNATAALIAEVKVDGITGSDGQLTPFGKSILRKWMTQLHNHPSVCFLTAGNEIGFHGKEKQLADYMTAFYNYIKSIDIQKRLVTPSSGLTIWQWNTPLPADYLDGHDYQNGDMGYMDCTAPIASFAQKHWKRIYGKIDKPVILGECGGYQSDLTLRPDFQALLKDGVLDRNAYVKWANEISTQKKGTKYWDFLPRLMYACFTGVRTATTRESLQDTTAKLYAEFIRRARRDLDIFEGLVVHDLDPSLWGIPCKDPFLSPEQVREFAAQARKNREFLAERQALAPLAALPDLHDRHRFAGEKLSVNVRILNDQYATPEKNLIAETRLLATDGTVVASAESLIPEVTEHARIDKTLTFTIPPETPAGDYVVHTRLRRGEAVVQENASPFYVGHLNSRKTTVTSPGKIALYERKSINATQKVLSSLGIPFTAVESMEGLDNYEVLIIGANSIDLSLSSEMSKVKAWLEKGGHLICLEQRREGPVAFAPGYSFKDAGDMLFADVIDGAHPTLQGLRPAHWEVWNGDCVKSDGGVSASAKAVYSHYIVPLPESVIISGGNRAQYRFCKNPIFGMVTGEVKVGKGLVFFSQALATSRYGTDPIATMYLRNVLEYVLGSQWTGERATAIK
ncbi:MAG: hypothetical protein B9S32_04380 [Verrucomicrobia bacterium Tous-C9LFEB]|nr:MAG: hypothetical protein B9S32_04380 [Verrucomicrobia bacterium Tous-C9LFEB]